MTQTYARLQYASPPYPGSITYFMTARGLSSRFRQRWQKVSLLELDDVEIPGDHSGRKEHSFLAEPHVGGLARLLRERLENPADDMAN